MGPALKDKVPLLIGVSVLFMLFIMIMLDRENLLGAIWHLFWFCMSMSLLTGLVLIFLFFHGITPDNLFECARKIRQVVHKKER